MSTLTFTIDNSASVVAVSGFAFTDSLPAGVVIADPTNASTTCTAGMGDASPGAISFSFVGGSVGAGATCTVQFDVTGLIPGTYVNTTGDLTSSSGNSGTATDTLTILNTSPIANAGGPYLVPEGTDSVVLSGLGSVDAEQPNTSLLYEWDFDNDGLFDDATGFAPTLSGLGSLDGPTTLPVAVRVTDASGETDTAAGTVMIVNVDPTVIVLPEPVPPPAPGPRRGGGATNPPAGAVSFLAMFFDFVGDTHTASVDWGDGVIEPLTVDQLGDTAALGHTYATGGIYTIIVTVTDDDGGVGIGLRTVTVNTGGTGTPRRGR